MANSIGETRKALPRRLRKLRKVLVLGGMALAACAGMQKGGSADPGSARGNQGSPTGGGAGGW